ncbi:MFS transporter [Catellatospora citrea]|uniref:MFS transporter n=1 Tax=Catellatospora citrea TaxID=53366 RepID=A0A8J3NYI7_9ACTN|nr:MFS transporter [Catellatospora citrea]RKE07222.1 putative MFS family arabinose efflux permease [Catellatospora citrea]GIF95375.1 MFS transporter [Catellatospora citrea]
MAARASYRDLVRITGPWFLVLAFLARLPAAMGPLGVITLVVAATGSYGTAGLAAAAYGIGAALGGPVAGTLADRFGQRAVGLATAVVDAAAYAALVLAVTGGLPAAVLPLAALAGFAMPQVGPLVRVRWAVLLGDRGRQRQLPTAMAYEGAVDEASFLAGPALVGILALSGWAGAPLLVASALTVLAAVPFALHRTVPPVLRAPRVAPAKAGLAAGPAAAERARAAERAGSGGRMPFTRVAVLVAAMSVIGVVFGATQTGVTAFADSLGSPGSAGLIYAVLGVGSALAGLAVAWLPESLGPVSRYVWSAAALVAGTAALLFAHSTPTALAAVVVLGVTAAPYLISGYALAGRLCPPSRAGMVMTLLASGVVAGVSLGAAVAGKLADAYGYRGAFAVPLVAAALGLLLAALIGPGLRRAVRAADRADAATAAQAAAGRHPALTAA